MFGVVMTGVAAIAEALKANVTLLSVKCALPFSPPSDQLAHKASAPFNAFTSLFAVLTVTHSRSSS
jgi:hypothetical protein